jgi:para-aminobenzoate synthetase/4-amino-4-deoxychorismate lyase
MRTAPLSPKDCFALLDDASGHARLYTGLVSTIDCRSTTDLANFFAQLEQALAKGQHAVGLFNYELGAALHGIAPRPDQSPVLASMLLFSHCERLTAVEPWLTQQANLGPAGVAQLNPGMDEASFCHAVDTIQAYIEAGDTYQANLTFPLHLQAYGDPVALYAKLRERQPVPYGALIRLPDQSYNLSLSPELFVSHTQGTLTAKPMKGTAAASSDALDNQRRAQALAADPKERAENLMIVDLLRNDLGRIAVTGSVQVPALFEVERFGSVLQMTSTITAQRRAGVSLHDMFKALYPCGSITGAPKHRTMQILRTLETAPRGLYTGAIGWFEANRDFTLSVPIRTLVLDPPAATGLRAGVMGIGAGIVHDSLPAAEYAECLLKARFLSALPAGFALFETMQASRSAGFPYLEKHLARLAASAAYFGFACDPAQIRAALLAASAAWTDEQTYRVKLTLQQSGDIQVDSAALAPLTLPVGLLLADSVMQSDDLFLRHKTTLRERYDAGWRAAEAQGAFDALFFNERGELSEGGRSTVFVKLKGHWYTPPLTAGILPGVMRSVLLANPELGAREQPLQRADLLNAEAIMVCNALRGALPAQLLRD